MGGELDFLVPPLRRSILTRDQARAMDTTKVSVDERVPGLGVVVGTLGEAEVPLGVLLPRVRLQESVLVVGAGLHLTPVAVEHVLVGIDEVLRAGDSALVH